MKSEEFLAVQATKGRTATAVGDVLRTRMRNMMRMLLCAAFFTLHSSLFTSCSEDTGEEDEYANWQERNEAYFATLADSLSANPASWQRIKNFSLDPQGEGLPTDYIYVKTIASGTGDERPVYTDSVRVCYQGRIIPTASYPQGYVFDGTVYGTYSLQTSATSRMKLSTLIAGMSTALQHMHRGDYWRVYIPANLGYGSQDKTSAGIPPYSTLVFDLTLVDFSPAGKAMPAWSARQTRWVD